jgi:hypothetical protein
MDADFSGFIVLQVNSGLFKGSCILKTWRSFLFTTSSARSATIDMGVWLEARTKDGLVGIWADARCRSQRGTGCAEPAIEG